MTASQCYYPEDAVAHMVREERARCAKIVDNLARILATPYTDPEPVNNTPERIQELHGDLAKIAADAIRNP